MNSPENNLNALMESIAGEVPENEYVIPINDLELASENHYVILITNSDPNKSSENSTYATKKVTVKRKRGRPPKENKAIN